METPAKTIQQQGFEGLVTICNNPPGHMPIESGRHCEKKDGCHRLVDEYCNSNWLTANQAFRAGRRVIAAPQRARETQMLRRWEPV